MASKVWNGAAQDVKQVSTITIGGTVASGDTYTVTINNKDVTYTAGASPTASTIASGLQALLAASTYDEFTEMVWTVSAAVITGTAATAGVPVTFAVSTTSSFGTITPATSTAATGHWHWDNGDNWEGGAAPVATDDVYIDLDDADIRYGLPAGAILFASVTVQAGSLGLAALNPSGYSEYRTQRATFGATLFTIGKNGVGPTRCKVNLGTDASTVTVRGTSGSAASDISILATNASTSIAVLSGTCSIALDYDDTSTVGAITVGTGATLDIGSGVTITSVKSGGTVYTISNVPTFTIEAGTSYLDQTAAVTTLLDIRDGTLVHRSTGTITDLDVGPGTFDCSQDLRSRTVSAATIRRGGLIIDPYDTVTWTAGIQVDATVDQVVGQ